VRLQRAGIRNPSVKLPLRITLVPKPLLAKSRRAIDTKRDFGLPDANSNLQERLIANVIAVGIETADMLVQEVLSRNLRDRRAVARFAGLTGSPNESGSRRRERGLAKSGNARVRRGLIQLAWRFLRFQKDSALAQWYRMRTEGPAAARRTKMIVALARKLLIAFWRMVTVGEIPAGFALRQPA
jgi:transposase